MNLPPVGFIGLGIMGAPMAGHLASAGYPLFVHDVNRNRAEQVAAQHASVQVMDTPAAVGAQADTVVTMLPSGSYVRDVVFGEAGLIRGWSRGALLLDCSSCEPWLTTTTSSELAERDIAMVDAPVSGARSGAEQARLVFMAGGKHGDLERVAPLLEIMGSRVYHLGPVGAGHTMKCINNLITSMTFMATAEGLTIGKRYGLDPDVMTDVLNESTGMSWISQTHIHQRITSRKFDDPFKLALMVKDVGIALKLVEDEDLPLSLSRCNRELWEAARGHGNADSSVSDVVRWLENLTGIEITPGSDE